MCWWSCMSAMAYPLSCCSLRCPVIAAILLLEKPAFWSLCTVVLRTLVGEPLVCALQSPNVKFLHIGNDFVDSHWLRWKPHISLGLLKWSQVEWTRLLEAWWPHRCFSKNFTGHLSSPVANIFWGSLLPIFVRPPRWVFVGPSTHSTYKDSTHGMCDYTAAILGGKNLEHWECVWKNGEKLLHRWLHQSLDQREYFVLLPLSCWHWT